jgi:diaminohydroxyphosphoribosylaminopyrimidine deaminase/5-amino-6-(5-phosphoribosylamino)uracil reductase
MNGSRTWKAVYRELKRPMKQREADVHYMHKVLSLAKKAEGRTSPNPLVGALIVKKGKILAAGYHKRCGLAHAEIEAIQKAGLKNCKGATLYVNLEPCSHFGRTPPCVEAILAGGFARVVIATEDPNPQVRGRSVRRLRRAGIKVSLGILDEQSRRLNEVFFKNMLEGTPFVVGKIAQSLDGKITTSKGVSRWITAKSSRNMAKGLRDKYDSVLVGINTVVKDNPGLDGLHKRGLKIIIDPELRIPLSCRLLKKSSRQVIIFASSRSKNKITRIPRSAKVFFLEEKKGRLSLSEMLNIIFKLGVMSVFVEGGSETLGRFFEQRLIDKVYFFIAPRIIGGKHALSSVGGRGFPDLDRACELKDLRIDELKKDILICGYPYYN